MNALLYISSSLAFLLAIYLLTGNTLPKSPRRLLAAALLTVAALNLLAILQIADPENLFVAVRPVLAIALPAILFLHIATAMRQEQRMYARDAVHIAGPATVAVLYAISGSARFVDPIIVITTALYLLLIFWKSRRGTGSFAVLGPRLSILFHRWSRMVVVFLAVAVILDATIMFEVSRQGRSLDQSSVLSLSVILLVSGFSYLLVSGLHQAGPLSWAGMTTRQSKAGHLQLIERLEDAMLSGRAYLDPNLTLQRLARKTGASIHDVSAAINDHRQCNYNQWLNGFRIEEAKRILRESPDRKITEVMFAAGFQNKSTFNAAFRVAVGESPSSWRNRIHELKKQST